jgi:hypothetical protein
MKLSICASNLLVLSLLGSVLPGHAGEPDLSKLPPPARQKGVTYAKDIRPLFEASCFRCHSGERVKAGLHLDSLEGVLKGGEDGKVVVAGKSEKSPLVLAVARLDEEKAMPPKPGAGRRGGAGGPDRRPPGPPPGAGGAAPQGPGGTRGEFGPPPPPLTAEQVGLVRAWVDQGAK